MNGFLSVNKPRGVTSSDVVVRVRRLLPRGTAIGHGGTLDPDASGVLPLCVGRATRLFDYIIDKTKTYVAELQLGVETDTQDAGGQAVAVRPVEAGEAELRAALPAFIGDILQTPPMYSAIKQNGQRLYRLAREGQVVAREARRCRVEDIRLLGQTGEDRYRLEIRCGKGVYIRTLCHDIGQALGCGGHMTSLERTAAGIFRIEESHTPDRIAELAAEGLLEQTLLPLDAPLEHLPRRTVGGEAAHAVRNGNPLRPEWLDRPVDEEGQIVRIYLKDRFAGIGVGQPDGSVRFRCMLLEVAP